MEIALYIIFFISCIVLVSAVLLQPGKTNAGALFTSNVSSNAFAPRGTATILSKITIVAASVFMVSALLLAMPAISGTSSVLDTTAEEAPAKVPVASPTATPAGSPTVAPVAPPAETKATEEKK